MLREIVIIDEERCDGCGECVPACHEGALKIIDGKARLVADNLCDGLGACLGHCPRGAIRIEQREADAFDEAAVQKQTAPTDTPALPIMNAPPPPARTGGCPGNRLMAFDDGGPARASDTTPTEPASALTHWPVQLRLLPPTAPMLRDASVLLAADCVPVASASFHTRLLPGRSVVLACPKLDDGGDLVARLAAIIARSGLREIVIARMEVPCCGGLTQAVQIACQQTGRNVPVREIIVSTRGVIRDTRDLVTTKPPRDAAACPARN